MSPNRLLPVLLSTAALVLTLAACGAPASAPSASAPQAEAPKAAAPTAALQQDAPKEEAAKPAEAPRPTEALAKPVATADEAPQPAPAAPAFESASTTATVIPFAAESNVAPLGTPAPTQVAASMLPVATAEAAAAGTAAEAPAESQRSTFSPVFTAAELRVAELEYPSRIKLGDSDIIRVSLVPTRDGYLLTTDFEGNTTITQPVTIPRPAGFLVSAKAELSSVGFDIDRPLQTAPLREGERLDLRWTVSPRQPGQHRLALALALVWTPVEGSAQPTEKQLFTYPISVQVASVLGMTSSQATQSGVAGLAIGAGLGALALFAGPRGRKLRQTLGVGVPNTRLVIEPQPSMRISPADSRLLQTLFRRYARLVLEREFRSGYSGARTFLALPIRDDGRADAYTIAKISDKASIQQEFDNFERFVKDTLPPITARIQETPQVVAGDANNAILRYTFIGEPGKLPMSLREALLANPDPAPIHKLFDTFGPNWWMQRKPHAFRVAEEYDRLLPAHFAVERLDGARQIAGVLDGSQPPSAAAFSAGDVVQLKNFAHVERRADGSGFSLTGEAQPGQPALRVRFQMSDVPTSLPEPMFGRVVATRESLLSRYATGMERFGLSDPLAKLSGVLAESMQGTQSTVHGDLNLENVLIGLGGFVWLIDFAATRDGHPLFDFAHLEADVIAHVIAPQIANPRDYLNLADSAPQFEALRAALRSTALRCLFNPSRPREYDVALYLACLGALKFANLNAHQKHLLYLTAAQLAGRL